MLSSSQESHVPSPKCSSVIPRLGKAVGNAESFETAQALVGAGGTIASLGVFGESCPLHLEALWHRNICLRTRLVDTVSTPDLLNMVESGGINPQFLVSHSFSSDKFHNAYEAFENSSKHGALKVIVTMQQPATNGSLNGST
ncbi:hypothetical protein BJX64DRAFT_293513 [Aspergillus heterothallicus]